MRRVTLRNVLSAAPAGGHVEVVHEAKNASSAHVQHLPLSAIGGVDPQTALNTADILELQAAKVRIVTGTSDTILAADTGGLIVYTNAAAIAVALPDGLDILHDFSMIQMGAGVPTLTPSGADTTNGAQAGIAPAAVNKGAYFCKYDTGVWLALI